MADEPSNVQAAPKPKSATFKEQFAAFSQSLGKRGVWAHALVILIVGFLIVNLLWYVLGFPAYGLNMLLRGFGPSDCVQYPAGTSESNICSLQVGLKVVLGPVLIAIAMFVLRKQISKLIKRVEGKIPYPVYKAAVPGLSALVLFTMGWAAIHWATKDGPGFPLFTHERFPILVGLFTLFSQRFGPDLQRAFPRFFVKRAAWKLLPRIALVSVVTILFSYLVMKTFTGGVYLTNPGFREQLIVLFALAFGWAMMAPLAAGLGPTPASAASTSAVGSAGSAPRSRVARPPEPPPPPVIYPTQEGSGARREGN